MRKLLENCQKFKLRLNIDKCDLIKRKAVWCGREISEHGWRFQTKYFDNLLKMEVPSTLGQLEDCVYLSQWLSPGVPKLADYETEFMRLATELKRKLNAKKGRQISRKTRAQISLGDTWTKEMTETFREFKEVTRQASSRHLALYLTNDDLYIMTDASKLYWSGVLATGKMVEISEISRALKSEAPNLSELF